jgi:hypothetical protein
MRRSDKRSIETAVDDSIRSTLTARSATNEANNGISRGVAADELQRLMDRVAGTHQDAVNAARELVAAVASGGVGSISQAAQEALASVESAKTAADQLSATRTVEQANSTRTADEEAVAQLTGLKAAFHNAPELLPIAATRFFICYRRDDSAGHAGRLFDALAKRFGKSQIFMDVAGIEPGADFVDEIEKSVTSCYVLLAVIGRHWLAYRGSKRKRRLDDPNDYVRLEIRAALDRGIRIIPILVQGAEMPSVDSLPEDIRKLTRKQGFDLRDSRWNDDVTALISTFERMRSAS